TKHELWGGSVLLHLDPAPAQVPDALAAVVVTERPLHRADHPAVAHREHGLTVEPLRKRSYAVDDPADEVGPQLAAWRLLQLTRSPGVELSRPAGFDLRSRQATPVAHVELPQSRFQVDGTEVEDAGNDLGRLPRALEV